MYVMESAPGPRTTINGRQVDYFCGTSYYGLHGHPELIKAACKASKKYGIGSATSRFGYGDNPVLLEVEQRAAKFFEKESALYYVSGYLGNSILLQGLRDLYDIIFADQESHYSVMDGASMSRKKALEILSKGPEMRRKLWENVFYAKKSFRDLGLKVNDTPVPIICLDIKGANLESLQRELFDKGIAVLHVPGGTYSSVPETGAIRIAIFSNHSREQIDRLVEEMRKLL